VDLDVPHLAGVYDTDPYLHDGRAKTLEEIFGKHNPQGLHGKAHELTPEELKDLIQYVREL
jgi:cytochrome c peroxidase